MRVSIHLKAAQLYAGAAWSWYQNDRPAPNGGDRIQLELQSYLMDAADARDLYNALGQALVYYDADQEARKRAAANSG